MDKEQLLAQAFALCDEIEQKQSRLRELLSQLAKVEPKHRAEMPHYIPEYAPVTVAQPISQLADEPIVSEIITETVPAHEPVQHKTDLRKSLTINDRFRFRRELFAGDEHAMNSLLDRLSECDSADDACAVVATLGWDIDSEVVAEFIEFVRNNFNNHRP